MRTELFGNNVFFYIFLVIISIDFVNALLLVSKPTENIGILVLKWLKLIIGFIALLMFFLKTNYNHQIFKIYIYFGIILMPSYLIFYDIKDLILYGVNPIAPENLIESGFALVFAIILLIFYNNNSRLMYFLYHYHIELFSCSLISPLRYYC